MPLSGDWKQDAQDLDSSLQNQGYYTGYPK